MARASGPQFLGPKNRPHIPTQFKYLKSLIFIIAPFKNTHFQTTFSMPECAKTHLQQCTISTFFRGRTPGPPGTGKERREEGRGGWEGKGGVDSWPAAPKTIIRHCCFVYSDGIFMSLCYGAFSVDWSFSAIIRRRNHGRLEDCSISLAQVLALA